MKQIDGAMLGVQAFVGYKPDPLRVLPLLNGDGFMIPSQKPLGGMWTSTWDTRRRTSAWMEDLALRAAVQRLRRGGLDCWLLAPLPDARVLAIETSGDLQALLSRYGRRVSMSFGVRDVQVLRFFADDLPKSQRGRKQPTNWLVPDYEALAADGWSGVHLTADGAKAVHFTTPNLYTWDRESTFWCCQGVAKKFGGWPFAEQVEHVGNLTERIVEGMLRDGTATLAGEDQRIASSGVKR